ncbi:DUF4913 domain-containing protein [Streptomyces sp. SID3343]|uniref:DUF4913 domain-containing protein n=1 Tax=Streptomyces sp. SID3343 TaxID=2690260 RepID=UPI00136F06EE|nr:DUF4913 domain-containing protein [Streptomyces sp. SID3343]MYV97303.1 DUF4913 domain-containing protein [Streptomyces sp. SID3343]
MDEPNPLPNDHDDPPAELVRFADVEDLDATLLRLTETSQSPEDLLERLRVERPKLFGYAPFDEPEPEPEPEPDETPPSIFILALDGKRYRAEMAVLTVWVHDLLLPVYGREITTNRPWCQQWDQHPEAVARLHGLWLAWQQYTDVEAGLAGPAMWHRDFLDPTWLQLRDPSGPFAACTTNPGRPNHRVLPAPEPAPSLVAGLIDRQAA